MSTDYEVQSAEMIEAEGIDIAYYLRVCDLFDEPGVPLGDQRGLANPLPPELREPKR